MGLEGILKSQQAEVVTVARQIVTEDLEALSMDIFCGGKSLLLSFPNTSSAVLLLVTQSSEVL